MICGARDGRWRRVLTLRCGEIVERRRHRRNAGDAEDGIEQGAIFGAEAGDFNSLLANSCDLLVNFYALLGDHRVEPGDDGALEGEFGFESAGVAGCGEAAPDCANVHAVAGFQ
jgi:hypothetical protein